MIKAGCRPALRSQHSTAQVMAAEFQEVELTLSPVPAVAVRGAGGGGVRVGVVR